LKRVAVGFPEAAAFVTGAWCVWLTVKEHIWNWPIGIASSAAFVMVFWQVRLFADMSLQVIYILLGFLGWYWWLRGGEERSALRVSRASRRLLVELGIIIAASTIGMNRYLSSVNDSAPLWDALTTTLSLGAQFLLTRKFIQNWYIWIVADAIYIVLYAARHLWLTSLLYVLFFGLCLVGLREWRQSLLDHQPVEDSMGSVL